MSDQEYYVKIGNVRIQVRNNNNGEREFRLNPKDDWMPIGQFVDWLAAMEDWQVLSELAMHGMKQAKL